MQIFVERAVSGEAHQQIAFAHQEVAELPSARGARAMFAQKLRESQLQETQLPLRDLLIFHILGIAQ